MFAERLKQIRIDKGLTQTELADYLEITPNAYRKYEYGEREPSFLILSKLSKYFNVTTDFLLGLTDEPNQRRIRKFDFDETDLSRLRVLGKMLDEFNVKYDLTDELWNDIAAHFGVSIDYLVGRTDDPESHKPK